MKDNHAALLAATSGGAQQNITVPMLQSTRFLPADFRETNAYRQQITSVVRRSPVNPNRVEALLVTQGGEVLDDVTLGALSSIMGASGGAIYRTNPSVVQGGGGAWSVPTADFSHGVTLEEGHLAYSLWLEGGGNSSGTNEGVLHRDAVPGHPDLNTMNTPLLMSAGTVRVVGDVCSPVGALSRTNTGRLLFCDGTTNRWKTQGSFFWEDPVVGGFADLPPCTNNGQTRVVMNPTVGSGARVYTCNTSVPEWQPLAVNDQGNLVVAGRVTANSVEAQNVKATTMTADKLSGELQVTPTAADGTACTGEGRLAKSSLTSGLILSCQSGTWKKAQGNAGTVGKVEPIAWNTWHCLNKQVFVHARKRSVGWVFQGVRIDNNRGMNLAISNGQSEGHLGHENVSTVVSADECFIVQDVGGGDSRHAYYREM